MLFLWLFVLEITVLAFTSHHIQTRFSSFLYKFTHNQTLVTIIYSLVFFPGTFLHELAHLFACLALSVRTGEISFWPKIEEEQIVLGHVKIAQTDRIRRSIVGLAPLIFGLTTLILIVYFTNHYSQSLLWWHYLITGYILFTISNSMFPSQTDLEGILELFIAIVVLVAIIALTWGYFSINSLSNFLAFIAATMDSTFTNFWPLILFLAVPTIINTLLALLFFRRKSNPWQ